MNPTRIIAIGMILVGLLFVGGGVIVFIANHFGFLSSNDDETYPNIYITSDGKQARIDTICRISVPQTNSQGVPCFDVKAGDVIDIKPSGQVNVGGGRPTVGPIGETGGYRDNHVDSPFSTNVGGLEMWAGSKTNPHYLIGSPKVMTIYQSGKLTFRTVDALTGFKGNGAYTVVVAKLEK